MSSSPTMVSRRFALAGLASVAATASFARAPFSAVQMPSVHRYTVGSIEVTAIGDGFFQLDTSLIPKATPEAVAEIQRELRRPVGPTYQGAVNTYTINTQ